MRFAKRYYPKVKAGATAVELAAMGFGPCVHEIGCPVPSNAIWDNFKKSLLPLMRIAFVITEQNKHQALHSISGMDPDYRADLIQELDEVAGWLRGNLKLVEAAQARMAIVCATLAQDEV
jgi:hypothetical protein